jgi:hypothetical protein
LACRCCRINEVYFYTTTSEKNRPGRFTNWEIVGPAYQLDNPFCVFPDWTHPIDAKLVAGQEAECAKAGQDKKKGAIIRDR